jgi:hypothetical protein
LTNLGGALRTAFAGTGDRSLLDRSVAAYQEALATTPPRSTNRGAILANLGSGLLDRAATTNDLDELDQAIQSLRRAVNCTEPAAPELPGRLNNLANALRERYGRLGHRSDLEQAVDAYRDACRHAQDVGLEAGLVVAGNWGAWASQRRSWPEAVEAYGQAADTIGKLVRIQLRRAYKETWLAVAGEVPPRAAYALLATDNLTAAVVRLEQGRARLLSDALERDRADLSALGTDCPDLAERYLEAARRVAMLDSGG